jgi:hypothetical protein
MDGADVTEDPGRVIGLIGWVGLVGATGGWLRSNIGVDVTEDPGSTIGSLPGNPTSPVPPDVVITPSSRLVVVGGVPPPVTPPEIGDVGLSESGVGGFGI